MFQRKTSKILSNNNSILLFSICMVSSLISYVWVCLQVWECHGCGKHRKRMEGSHLPQDTSCIWFWNVEAALFFYLQVIISLFLTAFELQHSAMHGLDMPMLLVNMVTIVKT